MGKATTRTRRRVNITLSEETLRLLNRHSEKGSRSRLIEEAVRTYVASSRRTSLRRLLREGAAARADRDLRLVEEWADLDGDAWPDPQERR